MINKKNIIIYSIILLFFIQIIINVYLLFYNKKFKITFTPKNYNEKTFNINENSFLTYYETTTLKDKNSIDDTIVFIHSPFESSLNSEKILKENFSIYEDNGKNFRVVLIDLPGHGKSFKQNGYDYSFRNVSSTILSLLESLNINNINLICDKYSSSIGLNMISLNDKIFSNTILLDPIFKYNSFIENSKLFLRNKILDKINFISLYLNNNNENLYNYVSSYFNNKNSSNKYVREMLKDSTPISTKDISSNINIFALISTKKQFDSTYLGDLSNNFSTILFLPKSTTLEKIIKKIG